MNTLKLSIISVNLNNADGLHKTIESVANQTYTNFEHIIIDGGSTDGSVDIIKEYEDKYTNIKGGLHWVSEPDKGIYNGMNKGIKLAHGEYCLFLNSGDWLISDTGLESVIHIARAQIVYCNLATDDGIITYPTTLKLSYFNKATLGHPSTLISKECLLMHNCYNENLKIAADYDFFCRAIVLFRDSYQYIDKTLSYFSLGGVSTNDKSKHLAIIEKEKVFRNLFPLMIDDYVDLNYLKDECGKKIIKKIVNKLLSKIRLKAKH